MAATIILLERRQVRRHVPIVPEDDKSADGEDGPDAADLPALPFNGIPAADPLYDPWSALQKKGTGSLAPLLWEALRRGRYFRYDVDWMREMLATRNLSEVAAFSARGRTPATIAYRHMLGLKPDGKRFRVTRDTLKFDENTSWPQTPELFRTDLENEADAERRLPIELKFPDRMDRMFSHYHHTREPDCVPHRDDMKEVLYRLWLLSRNYRIIGVNRYAQSAAHKRSIDVRIQSFVPRPGKTLSSPNYQVFGTQEQWASMLLFEAFASEYGQRNAEKLTQHWRINTRPVHNSRLCVIFTWAKSVMKTNLLTRGATKYRDRVAKAVRDVRVYCDAIHPNEACSIFR